ncbi:hypothetical protein [Ferruginibacter sp. HRS2-29]|uniref:hypothetical protein n=1 Tax=Ferruginibacter sp. HRS2-29 TaxID=2487334 RepID=UPI0020CE5012|nr:hypothetical protein [Ferruginibacter sp. HRS2-29]MCP9752464.1 hypothetical protein [Ferruginibacter sp. HRS2-29]
MSKLFLFILLSLLSSTCFSQEDKFIGTWQMDHHPDGADTTPLLIRLEVGSPEKNLLYPARLTINYGNFSGVYEILLVKKGYSQLGIGRDKAPVSEMPFSLGGWTIFLNGTFDIGRNKLGTQVLTANRIVSKRYGVDMPELLGFPDSTRMTAMRIRDLLRESNITLTKLNATPWPSSRTINILTPYLSDSYHGIMDTLNTNINEGHLSFADNNKIDNDSVFVLLNNKMIIDRTDLSRENPSANITLDTGMNILVFFADNYGKVPPNTGKMTVTIGKDKFIMNFANPENVSATFIVAKLYYYPLKPVINTPPVTIRNMKKGKLPDELSRNTKLLDEVHTESHEVTLAIWDDALEDGDSISLNINGDWLVKGFAVKKKPQFLKVKLLPGENDIVFIADNLGASAPNTSILEIIDGKRRRSFMISTDMKQNNLVRITYDVVASEP